MDYKFDSSIIIIEDMINDKKKEIGKYYVPEDYVLIIPQILYEEMLNHIAPIEENGQFLLYYNSIRIMFLSKNSKIFMVSKEEYNKTYNPCSFAKLV